MRPWAILAVLMVLLAIAGCTGPPRPVPKKTKYLHYYPDGTAWIIVIDVGRMYRIPVLDRPWRDKKPLPPPE